MNTNTLNTMELGHQLRQLIITLFVVFGAANLYALNLGNRIELDFHTTTSGTGWTYSNDAFTEDFDTTGATANPTKIGNNGKVVAKNEPLRKFPQAQFLPLTVQIVWFYFGK